jgi:hypothetical protein
MSLRYTDRRDQDQSPKKQQIPFFVHRDIPPGNKFLFPFIAQTSREVGCEFLASPKTTRHATRGERPTTASAFFDQFDSRISECPYGNKVRRNLGMNAVGDGAFDTQ